MSYFTTTKLESRYGHSAPTITYLFYLLGIIHLLTSDPGGQTVMAYLDHIAVQLCIFVTSIFLIRTTTTQMIAGSSLACENEGEEVIVKGISTDPCIKCVCKGGKVECDRERCPTNTGCYMVLFDKPKDQCCNLCKGCTYKGKEYRSGKEWKDPADPCQVYHCSAGVVTATRRQCYAPCSNPVPVPGKCCPQCNGCSVEGKMYRNGQSFSLKSDPCTQCTCKKGNVQCSKRACPVLNCPPEVIYTPKGTCCPRCNGSRTFFDLGKTRCLFRYKVYKEGQYMPLDKCTGCTCKTGTMVCESETCPPLTCAEDEIIRDEGSCCARCKPKKKCEYNGVLHEHRATWKPDLCTTCTCDNGSSKCELEQCSNRLECPPNHRLQMVYGQCCPKCVEEDAVCAVFGDPHYRTFDGRIFNFQGTCRYVLAQDCANNSFSVRVQNHARSTHSFAWTNRVSIHLGKTKIVLQQNLVIKVDNKKVDIPHVKLGAFSVMKSGYSVIVRTNVGLKVIWDGDSYVEVAVPAKYKSKMCGLCGNYNGIEADDFKGKKGGLYLNADKFGNSWRIGSRKSCYKSHAKKRSRGKKNRYDASCNNDFTKKTRAAEECSILKGQVFSQCRSKVPVKHYYRSCITDMCECPSSRQNCVCESLKAYARECERKGVKIDYSQTTCKGSR